VRSNDFSLRRSFVSPKCSFFMVALMLGPGIEHAEFDYQRDSESVAEPKEYHEPARRLRLRRKKIMGDDAPQLVIVDDDATNRAFLARALSSAGYDCCQLNNGREALRLVHEKPASVILADFKMPGFNAAEMLGELRSDPDPEIAQVPVIVLTGHGENEVLCLEAGADDFVIKPVNAAVLRARIETQLRLRSMRTQLQEQNKKLEEWRSNLERDLAAARLTQQSLIPQKPPTIPGWEVASCYRPVMEVGGDIYGWLSMRDGRYLFWIADATGHGASAALLTTLSKLLFHHGAVQHQAPGAIMQAVNHDFRNTFAGSSYFMTAMCVALDPKTGHAAMVGAGHPPLLVTRFGRGTEAVSSSTPPLGLVEHTEFAETVLEIGRGDALILYTDGLFGAETGKCPRLTPTQLAGMLNPFAPDAESLLTRMLDQATPGDRKGGLPDDVAALVVRRAT
jgi:phosphoserine phosphatase RsbU/P